MNLNFYPYDGLLYFEKNIYVKTKNSSEVQKTGWSTSLNNFVCLARDIFLEVTLSHTI